MRLLWGWLVRMLALARRWIMYKGGALLVVLMLAAVVIPAFASTNQYTVCDSGCSYTSLQSAINAVSGSSATSPWTIVVSPGSYSVSTAITISGKSYLTITGAGDGASVIQASTGF